MGIGENFRKRERERERCSEVERKQIKQYTKTVTFFQQYTEIVTYF